MALTKVTGSVIKDSVSLSGNVSVGGTLTYQDVTNVDALGIGTFRTGIKVLAGQVDVGSNIKLGNAGVITATSFVGNGAITINNNADNRVITGSGTANTLEADANLTWNNSTGQLVVGASGSGYISVRKPAIAQVDIQHSTTNSYSRLYMSQSSGSGGYFAINKLGTVDAGYTGGVNAVQLWSSADAPMIFATNNAEKLRIDSSGRIGVGVSPTAQYAHNLIQIGHQATLGANAALSVTGQTFLTHNLYFDTGGTLKVFNTSNANEGAIFRLVDGQLLFSNSAATTGTPTVQERLRVTAGGVVKIGGDVSNAGADVGTVTKLTIKQHTNTYEGGMYIERSGERRGYYMYVGGGLSQNDALSITTNQLGTDTDLVAIDRGGDVIIGSGNVGINETSPPCKLAIRDTTEFAAYAGVTPNSGNILLQLWNNPPNETANDHASMQFAVNGGTHNRVNTISAVAESAGNRKMAFTFCTDESGGRTEKLRITGDGHVLPGVNDTYDLGSSGKKWRNIYTTDLQLSNEGKTNDVDGTWGNYTIQEGESDLFLINNRSGKKYKFNLTEVS